MRHGLGEHFQELPRDLWPTRLGYSRLLGAASSTHG
jgi:hypothetical protein